MTGTAKQGVPQDSKPTYPVGVSVLLTRGNQLLLGKRKNASAAGLYSTPGGRIEQTEDATLCAIRETREETGITLGAFKFIDWREHQRFGQHYFMLYAHCSEWEGEIQNPEDKCEGWEWFDLDKLPCECTEPPEVIALLRTKVAQGVPQTASAPQSAEQFMHDRFKKLFPLTGDDAWENYRFVNEAWFKFADDYAASVATERDRLAQAPSSKGTV